MKTFQADIVKRFVTDKNYKEFVEDYKNHRYHSREIRKPSEKDLKIYNLVMKHRSYGVVAKMVGIATSQVQSAMGRAIVHRK